MRRIAVIGSREFNNYALLKKVLDTYKPFVLISGGSVGADTLAERFADEEALEKIIFRPDWKRYRKGASLKRNIQIIKASDMVIAFWDGISPGTKHSLREAEMRGLPVTIVELEEGDFFKKDRRTHE